MHLDEVEMNFTRHFSISVGYGFYIIWLGIASILHGLLPSLFTYYTPDKIVELAHMIEKDKKPRASQKVQ